MKCQSQSMWYFVLSYVAIYTISQVVKARFVFSFRGQLWGKSSNTLVVVKFFSFNLCRKRLKIENKRQYLAKFGFLKIYIAPFEGCSLLLRIKQDK